MAELPPHPLRLAALREYQRSAMSNKVSTKPPSGMRDFLPADIARRRHVTGIVREVYEGHGFVPLETPSIENLSTLLGKYGDEGDQLLYRLLHRRDALTRRVDKAAAENRPVTEADLADQGLRYDLTVPLARVVAQYGDLPRFFRRYQIQPVWRADRPARGRFREFYQCDVDVVGTTSQLAEADVCSAVTAVLERLGFADFTIRLNHRELLRALIRAAGIDDSLESTALVAVDKLDKIGRDGVHKELTGRSISAESATRLLEIIAPPGEQDASADPNASADSLDNAARNRATLAHLAQCGLDDSGQQAVAALEELLALSSETAAGGHLVLAPELARGLSYYTGPIFEIAVPDLAGSLGGGGRYDGLIGMFGRKQIPAVGFSLGLERIILIMSERDMYPDLGVGAELMLCWMNVDRARLMGVATRLRAQGLRVEVFPDKAKLGKQLQYSDTIGAGFAAIVGESELDAGQVTLKYLAEGKQETVAVDQVAEAMARLRGGG